MINQDKNLSGLFDPLSNLFDGIATWVQGTVDPSTQSATDTYYINMTEYIESRTFTASEFVKFKETILKSYNDGLIDRTQYATLLNKIEERQTMIKPVLDTKYTTGTVVNISGGTGGSGVDASGQVESPVTFLLLAGVGAFIYYMYEKSKKGKK